MHKTIPIAAAAATVALGALVGLAFAQAPAPGRGRGPAAPAPKQVPFTADQAAQGKAAYAKDCASCHGANLDDGQFAPALRGAPFMKDWGGKPADALYTYMATRMPPSGAGSLGTPTYANILAYLSLSNGGTAGAAPLPTDSKVLVQTVLPGTAAKGPAGPGGSLSPYALLPKFTPPANPLDKITPVTDANLQNPPASDWLTWRRTYDDLGFSPLNQINKANVNDLRVAWTWSLPNGANEATPLVHDGVIFVHSYGDKVQALNAVTGDLLWQYNRQLPEGSRPSVKKSIALHDNRLLVATSDLHMVALDVKTGKVVWDQPVYDPGKETGWQLNGGPLVAKGKVIVGTGGQHPGGNYVVALDLQTGKEAWKFHSIAQPGDAFGNSWNNVPLADRKGASVWNPGSYDPELNLVYFGTGQTYDTGPLLHPVNQPGVTNDALYTDTTLAFNPDTGKLVWHFQHTPNDQWDLDWAFERQVINVRINGVNRKLVLTAGKEAYYDALDAATGQYAFSFDMGVQNVIASVDPKTGAKTYNPAIIPGDGETKTVCPHAGGAKNWLPGSFNPTSKILYVPLVESCMDLIPVGPGERGGLTSGVRFTIRPRLDADGNFGRFQAVNMETKKVVWTARQHAPETSGALATAGGLAFVGSYDRFLKAYDDATGKVLWQTRLNDVPNSCPITYSVNGKQYIALTVGSGGAQPSTWPPLLPDIQNPPGGAAEIWVFELPAKK